MRFIDGKKKVKRREKGNQRKKRCGEAEAGSKPHLLYCIYISIYFIFLLYLLEIFFCVMRAVLPVSDSIDFRNQTLIQTVKNTYYN